jgi:hexosaminidase
MKDEGLKTENALQSYFVQRMEKYLNENGKKLIGWDEILEGGLAPNAAVMSWRGEEGGIAAARERHYVVMTPGEYCYFDHYQADPKNEPLAIGGFTPLKKVYSYEPVPAVLTEEESRYILGAQGNVWTEYMKTPEQVEYMAYPRAAALAEVTWSPRHLRDYENFSARLIRLSKLYDILGLHYCKAELQP